MLVYHYDSTTGIYTGFSSEADASPLEPGIFLIPAYATEQQPPEVPEGQIAVFLGDVWQLEDVSLPPESDPEPETEPPPPTTNENIVAAPNTLFGGPTIAEVFGAKPV